MDPDHRRKSETQASKECSPETVQSAPHIERGFRYKAEKTKTEERKCRKIEILHAVVRSRYRFTKADEKHASQQRRVTAEEV